MGLLLFAQLCQNNYFVKFFLLNHFGRDSTCQLGVEIGGKGMSAEDSIFKVQQFTACQNLFTELPFLYIPYRDRKNHDSRRRDKILRLFLCPEIGQFSPHFGAISLLTYTVNLEKKDKMHRRKFKNPVETAPRNCRYLSLVVVESVLTLPKPSFAECLAVIQ